MDTTAHILAVINDNHLLEKHEYLGYLFNFMAPEFSTWCLNEFDRGAAASIFAQSPKLVQMIQGRLGCRPEFLSTTCTDMDKDIIWVLLFRRRRFFSKDLI
ncbi:hypothetical protein BDZ45DRAFT_694685 [Acephala macrosclerotiorum]|nr:hypothetical protein BDZ45DRAFT_694685 [Acephala macrosclerotiorum]